MRQWSGGVVSAGIVDNYPLPQVDPSVEVSPADVERWLGIELSKEEIARILRRLEFQIKGQGEGLLVTAPDHRLDIGTGVIGKADVLEEIARIYGYENIPETRMADELPPQRGNPELEIEEKIRDQLSGLGLQEVVTYRMTSIESEARLLPPGTPKDERPYVKVANPIASERDVLRHSLISSLLEIIERNARLQEHIAIYEIGPVFLSSEAGDLPDELPRLGIAITGPRALRSWQGADLQAMDFYDLKGILEALFAGLKLPAARFEAWQNPTYHPGKCARVLIGERQVGVLGELHPLVRERYDLPETPLLAADLDLAVLIEAAPTRYEVQPVPAYPPVLEDLAVIVDEDIPAERVAEVIEQAGGSTLQGLKLFDVYRGEQIGAGKKSLAYSLTYQSPERTLTDSQVGKIRRRIVRRLEQEMGARLRS